jgi:SAM-dependent methyltransferase
MISRQDVEMAYRLILGREPESAEVVQYHRDGSGSLGELRERFLNSPEFKSRTSLSIDFDPPLELDTELAPEVLEKMFDRVEHCWRSLGKKEPYWSVSSFEQFKSSTFGDHEAEFYASGKREVERLLAWLRRNRIDPASLRTCTEYGCGVGRITCWLAHHFERVFGYDISAPHLELARQRLLQEDSANVTLGKVDEIPSLENLERVDLVFSLVVLQHNPPPVIAYVIRMLLRSLNPGGVACFQVPTYSRRYRFDAKQYLRSSSSTRSFEMHLLPQQAVFRIVQEEGCVALEVQPDEYVGDPEWVSNTFLIRRF